MVDFRYVPDSLEYAAADYGDYADVLGNQASRLNSQAGRFNAQARRLNSLSSAFRNTASNLNDFAFTNLLKYGEVSESDLLGNAVIDNALAYGKAWDAAQRNLTRMGINPNSGRFAGMNQSFAINRAAAEAGARNQARLQARNENFQRANAIAGLGYNYNSLGLNAANSATSALSGATSALNSGANAYNTASGIQRTYGTMLGQLADASNKRAALNDLTQFGIQQLGNNWGGTRTQAYGAAKAALPGGQGLVPNVSFYTK